MYIFNDGIVPLLLVMSVGGFVLSVLPAGMPHVVRSGSLLLTLLPMVYTSMMWWNYDASGHGLQMVVVYGRSHLSFGQDAVSLSLSVLTAALFPVCVMLMRTVAGWLTFVLLEILVLAALSVLDLLGFYVLFEASLILLFLLIARAPLGSMDAAYKIVLYTMAGSLLLLPVLLLLYSHYGSTNLLVLMLVSANPTLNMTPVASGIQPDATGVMLSVGLGHSHSGAEGFGVATQMVLGWGILAVFAVKIPLMPVHMWLPEAHVAAPTAGSVLLAGVLLKLGGLGFLRFMIPALPLFTVSVLPLVSCLCLASFLFSTLTTLRQIDLKKIVAYSSIAHMSLVTLAIFSLSEFSASGATLMMIAHGIVSPALFLLVGLLYDRAHTKLLLYLSGLGSTMPMLCVFFLVFTLANLSFPLFPNFVAELLCLVSLFAVHELLAYVYCICQVLGAAYGFWAFNKVVHGVPFVVSGGQRLSADHSRVEFHMVLPMLVGVLWLGVKPM